MREKFIDGTDNQYSIREDGVVIKHYNLFKNGKKVYVESFNKGWSVKSNRAKRVFRIKGIRYSLSKLLFIYYNHLPYTCKTCDKKLNNINDFYCDHCKMVSKNNSNVKSLNKNFEKQKLKRKHDTDSISRSYVAIVLRISINELSDDVYEHFKNTLLFKRKISREHNISISSVR